MNSPTHQRGLILFEQGRYADAEREFRASLGNDPHDAMAHAYLSLALLEQDKFEPATMEARQAIVISPDLDFAHYAYARAMHQRNRDDEAAASIAEAIRLDPWNANYHGTLGAIRLSQSDWKSALHAADQGLSLDPRHPMCLNVRAIAQTHLGDRAGVERTIAGALEDDPENAWTHANAGWAMLHRGKEKEALDHFKEALRLEPTMDYAKAGIVEALKSRFFLYRWLLMFFLWMTRLNGRTQNGLLIGGFVGQIVVRQLATQNPQYGPVLWPIYWLYVAFVLTTWLAGPLLNLVLRLHPIGKHALSWDQRRGSEVVAFMLVSGASLLAYGLFADSVFLALSGVVLLVTMLPASRIFDCEKGWPRWAQLGMSGAVLTLGLLFAARESLDLPEANPFQGPFVILSIVSQFATNALVRQRPRI
jgi:Tfp pilus assembly protein PilF